MGHRKKTKKGENNRILLWWPESWPLTRRCVAIGWSETPRAQHQQHNKDQWNGSPPEPKWLLTTSHSRCTFLLYVHGHGLVFLKMDIWGNILVLWIHLWVKVFRFRIYSVYIHNNQVLFIVFERYGHAVEISTLIVPNQLWLKMYAVNWCQENLNVRGKGLKP